MPALDYDLLLRIESVDVRFGDVLLFKSAIMKLIEYLLVGQDREG